MEILLDLDGTLTNPLIGITRCIQHAMLGSGREPPRTSDLARYVGLPLRESFEELLSTTERDIISRAIELYRERFEPVGMFENEVYAGVARGLKKMAAENHRLWVVTSKPQVYAQRILQHFGLHAWFRGIYGSGLDGRNVDKVGLIREVLGNEDLEPGETWMVGDRGLDIRAGRINGTRTAGVLWGYGTEAELRAEGPDVLVKSMEELVARICSGARVVGGTHDGSSR